MSCSPYKVEIVNWPFIGMPGAHGAPFETLEVKTLSTPMCFAVDLGREVD